MPGGEISIQASLHPNPTGRWITLPVDIAGVHTLAVVLDTGSPFSAISPGTVEDLEHLGLLQPPSTRYYRHRLTRLTVQGQSLPDLDVRVLSRLTELKVACLFSLDFFASFT